MVNRPKAIGTAAETALVRWLQAHGWPHAERRALRGLDDAGDVTGTPGVCWEVKAGAQAYTASDGLISDWLEDTGRETVAAAADLGVLVLRRKGKADPGQWWAYLRLGVLGMPPAGLELTPVRLRLDDAVAWLRAAGYGTPVP